MLPGQVGTLRHSASMLKSVSIASLKRPTTCPRWDQVADWLIGLHGTNRVVNGGPRSPDDAWRCIFVF